MQGLQILSERILIRLVINLPNLPTQHLGRILHSFYTCEKLLLQNSFVREIDWLIAPLQFKLHFFDEFEFRMGSVKGAIGVKQFVATTTFLKHMNSLAQTSFAEGLQTLSMSINYSIVILTKSNCTIHIMRAEFLFLFTHGKRKLRIDFV